MRNSRNSREEATQDVTNRTVVYYRTTYQAYGDDEHVSFIFFNGILGGKQQRTLRTVQQFIGERLTRSMVSGDDELVSFIFINGIPGRKRQRTLRTGRRFIGERLTRSMVTMSSYLSGPPFFPLIRFTHFTEFRPCGAVKKIIQCVYCSEPIVIDDLNTKKRL